MNGRVIRAEELSGRTTAYTYDRLGQLTSETMTVPGQDPVVTQYEYDAVGNLKKKTVDGVSEEFTYDANDRLVDGGEWNYTFDDNGNMTLRTNGTITETFVYDQLGRMVRVVREGGGPELIEYVYDFDGLVAQRIEDGQVQIRVEP